MKLAVTGASGLLGGRLASFFNEASGFDVVALSRREAENVHWFATSYPRNGELEGHFSDCKAVVHCAGLNAQQCTTLDESHKKYDVNALESALVAAVNAKVSTFIYVSTMHVYEHSSEVIDEECMQFNAHPYAQHHLQKERLVRQYENKINVVILRLSNSFGAPVDVSVNCWMLLINDLCRQGIVNNALTLKSNGRQSRNFIALSAVCDAIRQLVTLQTESALSGTFNLCSSQSHTVFEMAELIARQFEAQFGARPELTRDLSKGDDPESPTQFDTSKIRQAGIQIADLVEAEIRQLIVFCQVNFGEQS